MPLNLGHSVVDVFVHHTLWAVLRRQSDIRNSQFPDKRSVQQRKCLAVSPQSGICSSTSECASRPNSDLDLMSPHCNHNVWLEPGPQRGVASMLTKKIEKKTWRVDLHCFYCSFVCIQLVQGNVLKHSFQVFERRNWPSSSPPVSSRTELVSILSKAYHIFHSVHDGWLFWHLNLHLSPHEQYGGKDKNGQDQDHKVHTRPLVRTRSFAVHNR